MSIPLSKQKRLHEKFMRTDAVYREAIEKMESRDMQPHIKSNIQQTQLRIAISRSKIFSKDGNARLSKENNKQQEPKGQNKHT